MTLTLNPTPQEFDLLRHEAQRLGQPVEEFAIHALMAFIEHEPNEETIAAIEEARAGKGFHAKDADDLFRQCGIPLP